MFTTEGTEHTEKKGGFLRALCVLSGKTRSAAMFTTEGTERKEIKKEVFSVVSVCSVVNLFLIEPEIKNNRSSI